MLLMIENGIRGGISMISKRYAKANDKYKKIYKKKEKSTFIKYLDANYGNLYCWVMSEKLPTHWFKWMKKSEINNWKKHSCILELDVEYPVELHNLHIDYPLGPQRVMVDKVEKLIPNLED